MIMNAGLCSWYHLNKIRSPVSKTFLFSLSSASGKKLGSGLWHAVNQHSIEGLFWDECCLYPCVTGLCDWQSLAVLFLQEKEEKRAQDNTPAVFPTYEHSNYFVFHLIACDFEPIKSLLDCQKKTPSHRASTWIWHVEVIPGLREVITEQIECHPCLIHFWNT